MSSFGKVTTYWSATLYFALVTVFLVFVLVVDPSARTESLWFAVGATLTLTFVLWEISTNLGHFLDVIRSVGMSNSLLLKHTNGLSLLRKVTVRDHYGIASDSRKLLKVMEEVKKGHDSISVDSKRLLTSLDEIKKDHDSINKRFDGFTFDSKGKED